MGFRRASAWSATAALAVASAVAGAGCFGGVDKAAYVAGNARVLRAVPVVAGARLLDTTVSPYYREGVRGTQGYTTNVRYRFRTSTSVGDVARYYRRQLAARWRLEEVLPGSSRDGPVLNFCRGRASLSINLQSKQQRILEIGVDHAFFGKNGSPPSCAALRG